MYVFFCRLSFEQQNEGKIMFNDFKVHSACNWQTERKCSKNKLPTRCFVWLFLVVRCFSTRVLSSKYFQCSPLFKRFLCAIKISVQRAKQKKAKKVAMLFLSLIRVVLLLCYTTRSLMNCGIKWAGVTTSNLCFEFPAKDRRCAAQQRLCCRARETDGDKERKRAHRYLKAPHYCSTIRRQSMQIFN